MTSKITLYHQEGCGMCRTIKMMLEKNNIEFESCSDLEYMMNEKGITHTPVLEVDGNKIEGKDILDWIKNNK